MTDGRKRLRGRRVGRGWIVAGAAAMAFVIAAAIVLVQQAGDDTTVATRPPPSSQPGDAAPPGQAYDELSVVRRQPGDPLAMGEVDAPVVLVEWLDMRRPFCALFSRQTLPALIDEYIDAGLVRYEIHTVEFFGGQSGAAAVAVQAAAEQGMAFQYLEAVYAAAPDRGHPDLTPEVLRGFAEQVGIPDRARFAADLERDDLRAEVREETTMAGGLGVNTVPFFLVGDLAVAGAQPVEVFREVLDGAIADATGR